MQPLEVRMLARLRRGSIKASLASGDCWDVTNHNFSRPNEFFREKSSSQLELIYLGVSLENSFPRCSMWVTCTEPLWTLSGLL